VRKKHRQERFQSNEGLGELFIAKPRGWTILRTWIGNRLFRFCSPPPLRGFFSGRGFVGANSAWNGTRIAVVRLRAGRPRKARSSSARARASVHKSSSNPSDLLAALKWGT